MSTSGLARRFATVTSVAAAFIVAACCWPAFAQDTAKTKPKEGTSALVVTGCLKGRVLTVARNPNETGAVIVGADVVGRSFRLAGPKAVMADVKRYDRRFVEIAGLVRTSDLSQGPGFTMGGTRVTVGVAPGTGDPNRQGIHQAPVSNVVVMDVTSVRLVSEGCPIGR